MKVVRLLDPSPVHPAKQVTPARVTRLAARVSGRLALQPVDGPAALVVADEDLAAFTLRVNALAGLDLDAYKPRQTARRVAALMARHGAPTLAAYGDLLAANPVALDAFVAGLTINVSEFFRDPAAFASLYASLPTLLARVERPVVWSAGCSMGAELYSVGILLAELGALDRCTLIGTDLDRDMLARAADGLYHAHEIANLLVPVVSDDPFPRPDDAAFPDRGWLCRYFSPEGRRFRFADEAIRARAHFNPADLLADPPPAASCDLILCRNVLIYFRDERRQAVVDRLVGALAPGGTLVVGASERLADTPGLLPVSPGVFTRSGG